MTTIKTFYERCLDNSDPAIYTYDGHTLTATQWANKLGLTRSGFLARLSSDSMSMRDKFTKPRGEGYKRPWDATPQRLVDKFELDYSHAGEKSPPFVRPAKPRGAK